MLGFKWPEIIGISIIAAWITCGCGGTGDLKSSVQDVHQEYMNICRSYDDNYDDEVLAKKLEKYFVDPEAIDCPGSYIADAMPQRPDYQIVATWGQETMSYEDGSWKYVVKGHLGQTPGRALVRFKHALKDCDAEQFLSLMTAKMAKKYQGLTGEDLCKNPQMNDLYADLAALGNTHTEINWIQTSVDTPRWHILLMYENETWKIHDIQTR